MKASVFAVDDWLTSKFNFEYIYHIVWLQAEVSWFNRLVFLTRLVYFYGSVSLSLCPVLFVLIAFLLTFE